MSQFGENQRMRIMGGFVEIMGNERPKFKDGLWHVRSQAKITACDYESLQEGQKLLLECGYVPQSGEDSRFTKTITISFTDSNTSFLIRKEE